MHFQCSFPKFEAKFHANAPFFQIGHLTYNQKSRTALNAHNSRRWLRSNQRVMVAKLTRLTHRIAIQLHQVAESCTICTFHSRWLVWKLWIHPHMCLFPTDNFWVNWPFLSSSLSLLFT
jgi:hypothetical protein